MKGKIIVLSILIILAGASSLAILASDGYFDKKENKVLSVEEPAIVPVVLAKETTQTKKPVVVKKKAATKKAPVKKKTVKRKPVVKKKTVNLAPPVITSDTAPHSAKNAHN